MVRPCYLVVDPEHAGSISTRKLLIESAKFNVITAYNAKEAVETVDKFPAVDGIVADSNLRDIKLPEFIRSLKQRHPAMPIIVVGAPGGPPTEGADFTVEPFEPRKLLELLQTLQPEKSAAITQHEQKLESEG
jgi:DNA-binding NtrC family response regulator